MASCCCLHASMVSNSSCCFPGTEPGQLVSIWHQWNKCMSLLAAFMESATSSVVAIMRSVARLDGQATSGIACPNKTHRSATSCTHKRFCLALLLLQKRTFETEHPSSQPANGVKSPTESDEPCFSLGQGSWFAWINHCYHSACCDWLLALINSRMHNALNKHSHPLMIISQLVVDRRLRLPEHVVMSQMII